MPEPKWIFKTLPRGQTRNNAVGKEFFNLRGLKKQALAREAGQNSLDSNRSSNKLIMKVNLVERSPDKIKDNVYLSSLHAHASHKSSGISHLRIPKKNSHYRFLVIEDYNTEGARGELDYISDGDNNSFEQDVFHLFRSLQKTGKDLDEETPQLGSWGMGKNMYAQTSNLGGFFGYSIREHSESEFLFGMSILQIHKIDDNEYDSTGNFGIGTDNIDEITMPVVDKKIINDFKKVFEIDRKDENGLSVVIPCVYDGVSFEMLVQTFIETWMYAIIKDKMDVHIKAGSNSILITKNNIENHLHYFQDEEKRNLIKRNIDYMKMLNEAKDKDFISLKKHESQNMPFWKKTNYSENSINSWARKLDENNKLFLKVPVKIVYNDDTPSEWGEFKLFIFKDQNILQSNTVQYLRDILIIPGVYANIRLIRGYFGIVEVYGKLAEIIKNSEGPAHFEWSSTMERYINQNLQYGKEIISFVTNSAAKIKRLMTSVNRGTDETILADLLPLYGIIDTKKRKKKKPKKPAPPNVPRPPSICKDHEISGGFNISDNEEWSDGGMIGKQYKLMVSYDVDDGTAKNSYRDYHFSLDPVRPPLSESASGIRIVKRDRNAIDFIVEHRGWHYEIKGYNENYQLYMEVNRYDQKV